MEFITLNEKEYRKFLSTYINKTFLQSIEMANVNKTIGNEVCFLGVKKNNKIIAASLFIIKNIKNKKMYYSPRGLLLDYNDDQLLKFYVNNIVKYVKEHKGYLIKIDPYIELYSRDGDGNKTNEYNNEETLGKLMSLGFKYLNHSIQKKWLYVLDIKNKTKDDVFANLKGNVKNIIRKCEKIGIEIEILNDDLTRFANIVEETAERKNFSGRNLDYYNSMKKEFKENILIVVAKLNIDKYVNKLKIELDELIKNRDKIKVDGKKKTNEENISIIENNINKILDTKNKFGNEIDLASSMFCFYGREVVYLFSGSKEEFLYLNAPYLIQWYIIEEAINRKYDRYNFYGIEDLSDPKIKKHGVYDFKKGFNGKVMETIGELDLYLYKKDYIISKLKQIIKQII